MGLRTPEEFRQSLRDGRSVHFQGRRVEDVTADPVLRIGVESAAVDYQIAEQMEYRGFAVIDGPDGRPSSRFFPPPTNAADLLARHRLIETGSRVCFGFPPFAKEGGTDGLNATAILAARVDAERGTRYAERVAAYERAEIVRALVAHGGALKPVYEALGLSRKTLYEKMQKLGIDKASLPED